MVSVTRRDCDSSDHRDVRFSRDRVRHVRDAVLTLEDALVVLLLRLRVRLDVADDRFRLRLHRVTSSFMLRLR